MPVTYPKSSTVVADTDATAAQYNALRQDAVEARVVTLTAGEALTALDAVYVKAADGKSYKAKSNGTEAESAFLGIATTSVALNASVDIICYGFMDGFTGLTVGSIYFLGTTYGTISATRTNGANANVGIAISTTTMFVQPSQWTSARILAPYVIGGTSSSGTALAVTATLATTGTGYALNLGARMNATDTNVIIGCFPVIDTTSTNLFDLWSVPDVPAGKTVTNRYLIRAGNDTGSGSITNTFFSLFDSSSPFLSGVTTHTTKVDELKISMNGTTGYIAIYT